jgi:hypothetical protein
MVAEAPKDQVPLALEEEGNRIQQALAALIDRGLIQLEVHHNATLSQIERLLRGGDFHIFHFTGHAGISFQGDGGLLLVDSEGRADLVDGRRLGAVLLGTGVRTALLNSSHTAYGGDSGVGVAESLLQAGLSSVVAHNYDISDDAAFAFSGTFYTELAKATSIDQAMFAGRRAIAEVDRKDPYHWANPILFTRTQEGRFWTGEAGLQIETFLREGRLVAEAKRQGEFDAGTFANRVQVALDGLERIQSTDNRLKAQQLIADARDAIAGSNPELASQKLSDASTHIHVVVSEQERLARNKERAEKARLASSQRERRARWAVLGVSVVLLLAVALLGFLLRDLWTPSMSLPVIGLPISVIVWSFVGGVAAMLQVFVGTRKEGANKVSYEWLLWRPVIGTIMGSVIYLAIAAGLVVLGQDDLASLANTRNPYLLWALAFLGGFSDRFTILVFDNIVRIYTKRDEPAPAEQEESGTAASNQPPSE